MASQFKKIFLLACFLLLQVVLISPAYSAISFTNGKWETTFNCAAVAEPTSINCDGLGAYGSGTSSVIAAGYKTQITSAANNPAGGGGNGFRMWYHNGVNEQSSPVRVSFSSTNKIWVRFYLRYQNGFTWGYDYAGTQYSPEYHKWLYFKTASEAGAEVFEPASGNEFRITQGGANINTALYNSTMPQNYNWGWKNWWSGNHGVTDGTWRCVEIYMDKAANKSRIWIDGVLRAEGTENGGPWDRFDFLSNARTPNNAGGYAYVDVDDMVIYNNTPPKTDAYGNSFIGPIEVGSVVSDAKVISFTIPSISTSLTVPVNSFIATSSAGVTGYCVATTNDSSGCVWNAATPSSITFATAGMQTAYAWAKDAAGVVSPVASASVTISAPINGVCGSANGQSFSLLTSGGANLCSTGTLTSFAGSGPWTWGCNGSNGGTSTTSTACSALLSSSPPANLLFSESFENSSYSSRGWYDNTNHGTIATSGCYSGNCLQWAWTQGGTSPVNGGSMRMQFTPTDSLYISYYTKFQSGWRGSQKTYHPHMLYILSDLDNAASAYSPLANNYLTTYIEFVSDVGSPYAIRPVLAIQDQKRTNTSNGTPPNNLTAVTESRSVAYCNTPVSTGATGICYADNPYYSANTWTASTASLSENSWHKVEVYFKMNSISGGKGQPNGVMQEWIDGVKVIDRNDVLYRTNQDATKKWAQFVLAPYIGDGSPIAQKMWVDELTVATAPPSGVSMNAPANLILKSVTPN